MHAAVLQRLHHQFEARRVERQSRPPQLRADQFRRWAVPWFRACLSACECGSDLVGHPRDDSARGRVPIRPSPVALLPDAQSPPPVRCWRCWRTISNRAARSDRPLPLATVVVAPTSLPPCCSVAQVPPVLAWPSMRTTSYRKRLPHILGRVRSEHIRDRTGECHRAMQADVSLSEHVAHGEGQQMRRVSRNREDQ